MALRKLDTMRFELLAFESALRAHPGDRLAADALRDCLMEHGYTRIGAGRIVQRTIREATELWYADRTREWVANDPVFRQQLFVELRTRCPLRDGPDFEIVILKGSQPPIWVPLWPSGKAVEMAHWPFLEELSRKNADLPSGIDRVELRVGATWVRAQFSIPHKYCLEL